MTSEAYVFDDPLKVIVFLLDDLDLLALLCLQAIVDFELRQRMEGSDKSAAQEPEPAEE